MLVKNSDGSSNYVFPALQIHSIIVRELENMSINPKWALVITGNGSRYWIHPDSGKVVPIVEK